MIEPIVVTSTIIVMHAAGYTCTDGCTHLGRYGGRLAIRHAMHHLLCLLPDAARVAQHFRACKVQILQNHMRMT